MSIAPPEPKKTQVEVSRRWRRNRLGVGLGVICLLLVLLVFGAALTHGTADEPAMWIFAGVMLALGGLLASTEEEAR